MLFMAEFGMHADMPGAFKTALEPHLDYLRKHKDSVLLSATKSDLQSSKILGFVWIIEAPDADAAESLCQRDPFWVAGLRTSFRLSALTKALPDYLVENR